MSDTISAGTAAATLLCVDDEPNILAGLRRTFHKDGYRILTATSGAEGLRLLESEAVDLLISDMRMPVMDGAQFLAKVKEARPDTVRILLTGYADIDSTIDAINQGEIYRYIAKPWDEREVRLIVRGALELKRLEREKVRLEALTQRQNEELQALNANLEAKVQERTAALNQANEKLKASFINSIKVFSNLTELSEGPRTGHSRRVAALGRRIATAMGLPPAQTQDVMVAGLIHDIGKIGMPEALLAKSAPQMTSEEMGLLKKHPIRGEAALMGLEDLRPATTLLRSHHERYDGLGYPDGLSAKAIPLGARILAVANDFDALQIGSLSAKRLSPNDARVFIERARGKRYDPQVVDAFLALVEGEKIPAPDALGIAPADLKPGMVLSRDLISREGALLLASDYVLDASLIKQITDYARSEDARMLIFVRGDKT